ncbi:MAG: hypothetical protein ACYTF9_06285 [Planctomycetota bacterium]|jgi:hypothetical protein
MSTVRRITWLRWPALLLVGFAAALTLVRTPRGVGWIGGLHLGITPSGVAFTTSDRPITGDGQRWTFDAGARVLLGATSLWLPSRAMATVSVGTWSGTVTTLFVPWRPALISTAACALLLWGLWWRYRRVLSPGACARCGYDLAGTTADRCPECGTSPVIRAD